MHTKHVSFGSYPLKPWSPVLIEKMRNSRIRDDFALENTSDDSRSEDLSTLAGVRREKKVSKGCGGFKCGGQVTAISNVTVFVPCTWPGYSAAGIFKVTRKSRITRADAHGRGSWSVRKICVRLGM